jgi:hypothetical protein
MRNAYTRAIVACALALLFARGTAAAQGLRLTVTPSSLNLKVGVIRDLNLVPEGTSSPAPAITRNTCVKHSPADDIVFLSPFRAMTPGGSIPIQVRALTPGSCHIVFSISVRNAQGNMDTATRRVDITVSQ